MAVARDPEKQAVYSLTREEAFARSSVLSEVKYVMSLTLPKGDEYEGQLTVQFNLSDPAAPLWLDFKAEEVHELAVNSANIEVNWRRGKLHLAGLVAGANSVRVHFKNNYAKDGCGLHRFVDPEDNEVYLYTQFEPHYAQRMFPCFDQPDIKAVLELSVTAPQDWVVISNTPVASRSAVGGDVLTVFGPTARISTYLYAVCAGPYVEFRVDDNAAGVPLGFYCRKTLAPYFVLERYSEPTIKGFLFYNDFFNFPYPFGKYDQVFVPEFNAGAMENVGCVTYRDQYVFRDPPSRSQLLSVTITMLHEMAHMWFGNLVTMKWWDDLWLNESFADYICFYAISKALPEYPEVWQSFLVRKGWGYATDQLPTTHPISLIVPGTADVETIFDGISYSKGASVLKQMSFLVGEEQFRAGLRKYMAKYQFSNATFGDLVVMLDQEVELDLQSWADIWVRTAGLNELQPEVTSSEGKVTSFQIVQTPALAAHTTLRPHKIIAELYDADLNLTTSLTVNVQAQGVTEVVELHGTPAPAFVLLNGGDKAFVKVLLNPSSLAVLKENLYKISEPLSRQLIYRALWDMVRDLKLSGAEFADVVSSHLARETSLYNTTYTLDILNAALSCYVPEGPHKEAFYKSIFAAIVHKMRGASDDFTLVQLQKYIFGYVSHADDLATVVHWLTTRDTGIPGLVLSQADRWKILKLLSAKEVQQSLELVEAELRDDPSDTGRLAHLYCQNALPTSESKAEWWAKYTSGEAAKLSRYERESAMSGFVQLKQKELLAPYAQAYFDTVLGIIANYEQEYSLDFATELLPEFAEEDFLIERIVGTVVPEGYSRITRYFTDRVDLLRKYKVGKQLSAEYLAKL
jgi:aminopeptidase N